MGCELCEPEQVIEIDELAYSRWDNNAQSPGHLLVVPLRHVVNFIYMTWEEKVAVMPEFQSEVQHPPNPL